MLGAVRFTCPSMEACACRQPRRVVNGNDDLVRGACKRRKVE